MYKGRGDDGGPKACQGKRVDGGRWRMVEGEGGISRSMEGVNVMEW